MPSIPGVNIGIKFPQAAVAQAQRLHHPHQSLKENIRFANPLGSFQSMKKE
jgi:hypothetical protein